MPVRFAVERSLPMFPQVTGGSGNSRSLPNGFPVGYRKLCLAQIKTRAPEVLVSFVVDYTTGSATTTLNSYFADADAVPDYARSGALQRQPKAPSG